MLFDSKPRVANRRFYSFSQNGQMEALEGMAKWKPEKEEVLKKVARQRERNVLINGLTN
jgi:hypothetical protein